MLYFWKAEGSRMDQDHKYMEPNSSEVSTQVHWSFELCYNKWFSAVHTMFWFRTPNPDVKDCSSSFLLRIVLGLSCLLDSETGPSWGLGRPWPPSNTMRHSQVSDRGHQAEAYVKACYWTFESIGSLRTFRLLYYFVCRFGSLRALRKDFPILQESNNLSL